MLNDFEVDEVEDFRCAGFEPQVQRMSFGRQPG